ARRAARRSGGAHRRPDAPHPRRPRRSARRRRARPRRLRSLGVDSMRLAVQFGIDGLMTGAIYALVALGFTILWASMRIVSLAHPTILAIGAVIGAAAAPAGIGAALAAAAGAGALCGAISYYGSIRPLVGRSLLELMVSTLGLGIIAQEVLAKIVGPDSRATPELLPSGSWI